MNSGLCVFEAYHGQLRPVKTEFFKKDDLFSAHAFDNQISVILHVESYDVGRNILPED